ncbi:MAG: valine--tRNA ligase, partial [Candidatus Omnitrophica bacterium]|nr:valine--tRNA ligase [Candidatus Omnitrophota bacterium]
MEALWMPGTDHAGIATQNVVEKQIAKDGLRRQDLGREKFVERVWQWKEQYGSTIIMQLKKLGSSCDWDRTRFTMDEGYSGSVADVFKRLYDKGLIYRGDYIINWCPRCQTALSDEEAPHHELQGHLYYIKYPLKEDANQFVTVATTRPETMLGDTAVAVNPKDKRYKKLLGKTLILPLVEREIKIIADSMVDMAFGTGAVKVTPAHDPNDYALGKKHKLEFVNVMRPDARMNENAGDYRDMDRFEAREVILEDLKEKKLLVKEDPHNLSAGHCYRCHTIIEPYLSKQWFVKMKPLAKPAIEAVKKGRIKFYPDRWTKVYLNWMENIQDWCISRQIWWGHRLPVYYCKKCEEVTVSLTGPEKCPACGSVDMAQDEDVLDTWFSSWLWPFATFKDEKDLKYFYPTSALVTAQEIIFFWVARMIMAGIEFQKEIPFRDVYIHGTVRDDTGKKMSKSLGNIIDPLEIIKEFGADALRFSIISITAVGQDVFLSKQKFEFGRNFANKIWNASRFIISNLKAENMKADLCASYDAHNMSLADKWILSRFYQALESVEKSLENYRFNEAALGIYEFFWHEFCDWYIELSKAEINEPHTQLILYKVLEKSLRVLHPFMPFITEEIWHSLSPETIMTQPWPHVQKQMINKKIDGQMQAIIDVITAVRNIRAAWNIDPKARINILVKAPKDTAQHLNANSGYIKALVKAQDLKTGDNIVKPPRSAVAIVKDTQVYVPLEALIDLEKEKGRISKKIEETNSTINGIGQRLKNKEFLKKAPKDIVEGEKKRKAELAETLRLLEANLKDIA